ncbi:hypothetical protein BG011_008370 [Mortierella polycephala]|uniref:Acetyl-CoA synthetase-like protein n=1 Tax=Mortierella polycephala TaxID=41804 RepID=A0A9P6U825_9FUNG|nr:hypothetical protein BG011_008370 [Mortierella polycephala]
MSMVDIAATATAPASASTSKIAAPTSSEDAVLVSEMDHEAVSAAFAANVNTTSSTDSNAVAAIAKPAVELDTSQTRAKDDSGSGTSAKTDVTNEDGPVSTDTPKPVDLETIQKDNNIDTIIKDQEMNVDNAMGQDADADDIASDIQERSEHSDVGSQIMDLADENATEEVNADKEDQNRTTSLNSAPAAPEVARGINEMNNHVPGTANPTIIPTIEAPVSVLATAGTVPAPSVRIQSPSALLEPEGGQQQKEATGEQAASYTSPHHEWARILKKRLGKGLNDAQLLARSNSMLASPSILAQSLTQVIPSLQVKDTSALSPGSSSREYQTPEELFDRPAAIEPSVSLFHYNNQMSKDEAFPSSTLVNNSQTPLLLFASLNPDQLYGKSSSTLKPTAPPSPAETQSSVAQPQPQGQSQSHMQSKSVPSPALPQQSPSLPQQQPPSIIQPVGQQTSHATAQPTPTQRNAAASQGVVIPSPSSAPKPQSISPTATVTRQSPLISKDNGVGAMNPRHSVVLLTSTQDDRLGVASHSAPVSRTLLAQGSSSSLTTTPPSISKDQQTIGTPKYPIAPIQYTPLTQYKANPSKEGPKANKKPRENQATAKDAPVTAPAGSSADHRNESDAQETADPRMTSTLDEPKPDSSVDMTALWALEALSGLSDVNFDATLPVSVAVATTLANSYQLDDSQMKLPMAVPPISVGSRSNITTKDTSPKIAKVIPSPFESTQMMTEQETRGIQLTGALENTSSHPGAYLASIHPLPVPEPVVAIQSNHVEQHAGSMTYGQGYGYRQGTHGMHQQGRSISSLRDVQAHSSTVERASLEAGRLRRGELGSNVDAGLMPVLSPVASVKPSVLQLGSGYQIPWLPESRPNLPPRSDVNSIDVPALTGKQQLPYEPRPLELDDEDPCLRFTHLGEALRHWGQYAPEGNAFANLDGNGVECGSWDWAYTLGRAEMIAKAIHDKTQLRSGARVALVFRISEILEFVAAFYGAILAGVVPVLVNQIQEFSEMVYIMTSAKVELALTTQFNHKSLQKDLRKGAVWPSGVTWWQTDILETWAPKKNQQERLPLRNNELAYIEYTKSAAGELKGIAVSHKNLMVQCQSLYSSFFWRPALYHDKNDRLQPDPLLTTDPSMPHSRDGKVTHSSQVLSGTIMTWLEPRQQSGLVLGCIMGVFCGNFTVFMESSIAAISGLWAHSVAAYRANIAFADYSGIQRLLKSFRMNPQATVTPTRPDLRFLQTVYVDTHCKNPRLDRDFLDDYLYPLGMIPQHDPNSTTTPAPESEADSQKSPSSNKTRVGRSDLGVIPFLSLPEHGGMIVCLRDTLDPPQGVEKMDFRKQFRKSTLPDPRRPSTEIGADPVQPTKLLELDQSGKNGIVGRGDLQGHPMSSLVNGMYLLHRGALRSNRVAVLATGEAAFKRRDEPNAILVGAFGYPAVQSTLFVADPETLALSLPDVIGEIWVSSPGMPVGFWGLPEHTQEVFNAKPYIITEENMIPSLYCPQGCEKLLRTGLLGAMIEGRVVVFGTFWERLQQDMADPMKSIGTQYEYHHAPDLKQTILDNVSGVGEISVFGCIVNKEYLPVVCIELTKETRSNAQPINTVAQYVAVNTRHILRGVNALRSYCIAVWDTNTLPRIFENGRRVIDHALCKKMFELGRIFKILYFATFTEDVLFNIPKGDDPINGFWSRDCIIKRQHRQGALVRYVQHTSNIINPGAYDEKTNVFMGKFHNITDILIWRSIIQPDDIAFIELDARGKEQKSIPFKKFNQRVTGCAMYLEKKCGLKAGDHVILWFPQDLEYIVTLHACWVLGLIPIPLQLPENIHANQHLGPTPSHFIGSHPSSISATGLGGGASSPFVSGTNTPNVSNSAISPIVLEGKRNGIVRTLLRIMDEVKIKAILGNQATDEYLKQKTTGGHLRACRAAFTPVHSQTPEMFSSPDISLPQFHNVTKAAKTKHILGAISGYAPRKEWFGANYPAVHLIDPEAKTGTIAGRKLLKLNHETLNNLCRNQKLQFKMLTGQPNVTCMSIFSGLGFIQGCLSGIYNGGPSVILQPADFSSNPIVWLEAISRYKAQDVALTYPLLDQLLLRLDSAHITQAQSLVSLESVKNFMVCGHGRIQREKSMTALVRLGHVKLASEALNLVYSHPLNFMATTQAERATGSVRIHVSSRQLRYGIVMPTSEGDDPTGVWLEDTGISTVCTSIAIVHPETLEVCAANQIGEIWICADSNVNSFYSAPGSVSDPSQPQPFGACISRYDNRVRYMRTGDLGFLWNSQQQQHMQQHQAMANAGQRTSIQTAQTGNGPFQLFVLGSMEESFQVNGLLHFAMDIETTMEGAHANVASQGCLTFKTPQGHVVCVVKVQNQEPEVLVSMYIPVMHAILEKHQFLPDTIVLVGDNVSTARRLSDGLKPRESICSLYTSERLPILHLHHCHGKVLPPMSSALSPPTHDGINPESPATSPLASRSSNYTLSQQQQQQQPQPPSSSSSGRFLTGISPAPMTKMQTSRASNHLHAPAFSSNGSTSETQHYSLSNRNSLFGSPLLVSNIPLPPGTANPLTQSPMMATINYQPQTQYQPGTYTSTSSSLNPVVAPVASQYPMQQSIPASSGSTTPSALQRPMSQQAFVASPPHSGGSPKNAASAASGLTTATQSLLNEMAMWGPSDRSRGSGHRHVPQQQHSQPHLQQGHKPIHPRQILSHDARSLSAEELRPDSRASGTSGSGGVKSIMKGMNAKWSEMRKAV